MARIGLIAIVLLFIGHFRLYLSAPSAATGVRAQPIGDLAAAAGLWRHRPAGHLPRRAPGGTQPARHLYPDRRHAGGHSDRFAAARRLAGATLMVLVWGRRSAPCRYAHQLDVRRGAAGAEAGQALLVRHPDRAASGALLGGEVVDWQGVSSAMLFGGADPLPPRWCSASACAPARLALNSVNHYLSAETCPATAGA
ncbi:hypothetical protein M8494_18845 [Serratia ureilytica]